MASDPDAERRLQYLESEVGNLRAKLEDLVELLKRSDDPAVKRAANQAER